jgi:hypothetical protein
MLVAAAYGKEYAALYSCALVKSGSCFNGGGSANAKLTFFIQPFSDYEYVQEAFTYSSIVDAALEESLECTWTSPIRYALLRHECAWALFPRSPSIQD